ncbi:MAG: DUF559 domain-containing protein [Candidatus Omnitrophota bacterium]
MLAKIFDSIPKGEVKVFAIPAEAWHFEEAKQAAAEMNYRVIVLDCASIPPVEPLIDYFLREISKIALAIWPHWFDVSNPINLIQRNVAARDHAMESYIKEVVSTYTDISREWLKDAIEACHQETSPYSDHYPKALQAKFLAKAIHPDRLTIVIQLAGIQAAQGRLYGLIRAAEWIASQTNASIALIADREIIDHPEMSSAILGSIELEKIGVPLPPKEFIPENKSAVWPIIGIPHPLSPGEQLLAKRMQHDAELSSLFGFNQRLQTVRNNYYIVDMLWSEERLIVEVDGYRYHSHRAAFLNDRQRDYEFILSGYRVLRLDHDEVISDVELAMDKIRDVVRFCQEHPIVERMPK